MAEIIALEADLSEYEIDVLLRAAFSLTYHINTKDARTKRTLIVQEIKRRCDGE